MTKEFEDNMHGPQVLQGAICYLVGPIDFAADAGVGWRKDIINKSDEVGLEITYLDPTDKVEGMIQEVEEEQNLMKKYRQEHNWDEFAGFMKQIVHSDLRMVDYSDFIIMKLDPTIHMCGSYHELVIAVQQKKPVFLIVEGGKEKCPSWIFGILNHKYIYNNVDEVVDMLSSINKGEHDLSYRWTLIRQAMKRISKKVEDHHDRILKGVEL
jgi:nucleoside 2-deoxyribosyltransferase